MGEVEGGEEFDQLGGQGGGFGGALGVEEQGYGVEGDPGGVDGAAGVDELAADALEGGEQGVRVAGAGQEGQAPLGARDLGGHAAAVQMLEAEGQEADGLVALAEAAGGVAGVREGVRFRDRIAERAGEGQRLQEDLPGDVVVADLVLDGPFEKARAQDVRDVVDRLEDGDVGADDPQGLEALPAVVLCTPGGFARRSRSFDFACFLHPAVRVLVRDTTTEGLSHFTKASSRAMTPTLPDQDADEAAIEPRSSDGQSLARPPSSRGSERQTFMPSAEPRRSGRQAFMHSPTGRGSGRQTFMHSPTGRRSGAQTFEAPPTATSPRTSA